MELGLNGKSALVAGASSGIGKAIAESLLAEHAQVAILSRDATRLEQAAADLEQATGSAPIPVVADVTRPADIERAVATTVELLGAVDIVVANAGGPPAGLFSDHDDAAWENAFHLNLMSGVRLARAALPGMRTRRWGRVIFLTSMTVKQPEPGLILSNAVRAGVTGMAKTLSREVAADGVTVNSVCPGFTDTERLADLASSAAGRQDTTPEAIRQGWIDAIPTGRLAQPAEVGDLVAFLASERAAYLTGVTIQVDGGYVRSLL